MNAVKAFRHSLGLTVRQFAYAIGHWDGDPETARNKCRKVMRWESGEVDPPGYLNLLVQACAALEQMRPWLRARGLSVRPEPCPNEP